MDDDNKPGPSHKCVIIPTPPVPVAVVAEPESERPPNLLTKVMMAILALGNAICQREENEDAVRENRAVSHAMEFILNRARNAPKVLTRGFRESEEITILQYYKNLGGIGPDFSYERGAEFRLFFLIVPSLMDHFGHALLKHVYITYWELYARMARIHEALDWTEIDALPQTFICSSAFFDALTAQEVYLLILISKCKQLEDAIIAYLEKRDPLVEQLRQAQQAYDDHVATDPGEFKDFKPVGMTPDEERKAKKDFGPNKKIFGRRKGVLWGNLDTAQKQLKEASKGFSLIHELGVENTIGYGIMRNFQHLIYRAPLSNVFILLDVTVDGQAGVMTMYPKECSVGSMEKKDKDADSDTKAGKVVGEEKQEPEVKLSNKARKEMRNKEREAAPKTPDNDPAEIHNMLAPGRELLLFPVHFNHLEFWEDGIKEFTANPNSEFGQKWQALIDGRVAQLARMSMGDEDSQEYEDQKAIEEFAEQLIKDNFESMPFYSARHHANMESLLKTAIENMECAAATDEEQPEDAEVDWISKFSDLDKITFKDIPRSGSTPDNELKNPKTKHTGLRHRLGNPPRRDEYKKPEKKDKDEKDDDEDSHLEGVSKLYVEEGYESDTVQGEVEQNAYDSTAAEFGSAMELQKIAALENLINEQNELAMKIKQITIAYSSSPLSSGGSSGIGSTPSPPSTPHSTGLRSRYSVGTSLVDESGNLETKSGKNQSSIKHNKGHGAVYHLDLQGALKDAVATSMKEPGCYENDGSFIKGVDNIDLLVNPPCQLFPGGSSGGSARPVLPSSRIITRAPTAGTSTNPTTTARQNPDRKRKDDQPHATASNAPSTSTAPINPVVSPPLPVLPKKAKRCSFYQNQGNQ